MRKADTRNKRPRFPARFFPSRSSGREVGSWAELMRAANEYGTGWIDDADGVAWSIAATYRAERARLTP